MQPAQELQETQSHSIEYWNLEFLWMLELGIWSFKL
jgi:hypothetical protein